MVFMKSIGERRLILRIMKKSNDYLTKKKINHKKSFCFIFIFRKD